LHDAIGGHRHVARAKDHVVLGEVQHRDALPRQGLHHVTLLETWDRWEAEAAVPGRAGAVER